MASSVEIIDRVLIPGVYDILSTDHKRYLLACISEAAAEAGVDSVTIGLATDKTAHSKGPYRPFFSYGWRQEDISTWYSEQGGAQTMKFEEFDFKKLLRSPSRSGGPS